MKIFKIIFILIAFILPVSLMAQDNNKMASYTQSMHAEPSHINTYDEALHNHQVEKISNEPINVRPKKVE